ncbi:hypothetical protein SmJEL517_g05047 [Synchytrium microbalum]|uniref:PX domain-containing protein n=1 Tax=Synchytrium microbalum TaxID=1806994 RepID=A0A507C2B2_9FUNG|nr:uncharacterized protein SmJEL517_g05047 [Synchytrium microbalum]TPX31675.1 hypothetical protein SmJEL517_g05047 [Synchytrium microbalum]
MITTSIDGPSASSPVSSIDRDQHQKQNQPKASTPPTIPSRKRKPAAMPPVPEKPTTLTSSRIRRRARLTEHTFDAISSSNQSIDSETSHSNDDIHEKMSELPDLESQTHHESDRPTIFPTSRHELLEERLQPHNKDTVSVQQTSSEFELAHARILERRGGKTIRKPSDESLAMTAMSTSASAGTAPFNKSTSPSKKSIASTNKSATSKQEDLLFSLTGLPGQRPPLVALVSIQDSGQILPPAPSSSKQSSHSTGRGGDDTLHVVPIYAGYAIYDFTPDPSATEMLSLTSGECVTVFGCNDIKETLLAMRQGGGVAMNVEVSPGWCQCENASGMVGFVPLSYLQFMGAPSAQDEDHDDFYDKDDDEPLLSSSPDEDAPINALYPRNSMIGDADTLTSSNWERLLSLDQQPTLAYASPLANISSVAGLVAGKLQGTLRRIFLSMFSDNSLHEYISTGGVGGPEGRSGGRSLQTTDSDDDSARDRHYITAGPKWQGTIPPFLISVRRPVKRRILDQSQQVVLEEFVTYRINSWFPDDVAESSAHIPNQTSSYHVITVDRRFKQVEWLHDRLLERFPPPSIILPSIPSKNYAVNSGSTRFDVARVERRRREIEVYLSSVIHHPVLRNEPAVLFFLSCGGEKRSSIPGNVFSRESRRWIDDMLVFENTLPSAEGLDESEWKKGISKFSNAVIVSGGNRAPSMFDAGNMSATFFKRVYHPEFNVPEDGDPVAMSRFGTHLELFQKHVVPFLEAGQRHEAVVDALSKQYSALATSMDSLARGTSADRDEDGRNIRSLSWCWREGCRECFAFGQGMVAAASHLHSISNIARTQTKTTLNPFLIVIKSYSSLLMGYTPLVQMHGFASDRYDELVERDLTSTSSTSSTSASAILNNATRARIGTIFNVTLAEMERLHSERRVMLETGMKEWLNNAIESQQAVLNELIKARDALCR